MYIAETREGIAGRLFLLIVVSHCLTIKRRPIEQIIKEELIA